MTSKARRDIARRIRPPGQLWPELATVDTVNADGTITVTGSDNVTDDQVELLGAAAAGAPVWLLRWNKIRLALGSPASDANGGDANGDWTVLSSGLLVCRHNLSVTANPTTWTFPHEFAAAPVCQATAATANSYFATVAALTTTTAAVRVFDRQGNFPAATDVCLTAFGTAG